MYTVVYGRRIWHVYGRIRPYSESVTVDLGADDQAQQQQQQQQQQPQGATATTTTQNQDKQQETIDVLVKLFQQQCDIVQQQCGISNTLTKLIEKIDAHMENKIYC